MHKLSVILAASTLLLALPLSAHAELLAVLELSGSALPAEQRAALTDAVRQAATNRLDGTAFKVMTQGNMETLLTDMGLDASCLSEGACDVDTLRNLQADYGVTGKITDFGGTMLVTLQLYETRGGTMMGSKQVQGEDPLALVTELIPPATGELLAKLPGVGGVTSVTSAPQALSPPEPIPDPPSEGAWVPPIGENYLPDEVADRVFPLIGQPHFDAWSQRARTIIGASSVATVNAMADPVNKRHWKKKGWKELAPCDHLAGDEHLSVVQEQLAALRDDWQHELFVGEIRASGAGPFVTMIALNALAAARDEDAGAARKACSG